MSLLYYIRDRSSGISAADLEAAGLGHTFGDGAVRVSVVVTNGPEGRGVIVTPGERSGLGYFPDVQRWLKIPGRDGVWVGCRNTPPVAAEDLARPKQLDGSWVRLGDGHEYLVPIARGYAIEDGELRWVRTLPAGSRLDDSGEWVPDGVAARYRSIWDVAQSWLEARCGAKPDEAESTAGRVRLSFEFAGLHAAAITVLAVNYRLAAAECELLGLLDEEIAQAILDAAVEWGVAEEWLKKKPTELATGSPSTDAGPPGSTPATGRP